MAKFSSVVKSCICQVLKTVLKINGISKVQLVQLSKQVEQKLLKINLAVKTSKVYGKISA